MLHVALYVLTALGIPFFLGYPIVGTLRSRPGLSRIIIATLTGLAILIVTLRSLQYLFPIHAVTWWVLAACAIPVVFLWLRTSSYVRLLRDIRAIGAVNIFTIMALCVGLVIFLNLPTILFNARSFEGTPNHDSFYYVVVAKFMVGHSFYEKIPLSPGHPVFAFMPSVFGWGTPLGRVGAEGYLAWLSVLFNKDPVLLYNSLSTAGAILLGLTSVLLFDTQLMRATERNKCTSLLVILGFLSPSIFTCVFNSNYATIYGVIFFAAYMATSLVGYYRSHRIFPIIFCAALIAVYPELVPIAWACLAVAMTLRWVSKRLPFNEVLRLSVHTLINAITGVILFPWTTLSAWFVAKHSLMVASGPTATYSYPHLPPGVVDRIAAFVTTSNSFATELPHEVSLALFVALAFVFFRSLFSGMRRGSIVTAGIMIYAVMGAVLLGHHYSYGSLKATEYFSPFIIPAFANGQLIGVNRTARWFSKGAMALPGVVIVITFAWAISTLVRTSITWGRQKRIDPSTLKLASFIRELPRGALLTFGPIPSAYYYTMWLPYLSNRTFLFTKQYDGGYLAPYVKNNPFAPIFEATYTVQSSSDDWAAAPFPSGKVYRFGRFELVYDPGAVRAFTNGLYPSEGTWAWMGDDLRIYIGKPKAAHAFLNIYLADRFHPVGSSEQVTVKIDGNICKLKVSNHGDGLTFRIGGQPHQEISITPDQKGASPKDIGMSADARILTYRVTQLGFSDSPKYKMVSCHL